MNVLSRPAVAKAKHGLAVGVLPLMMVSCSLPHVSDVIPQRGDTRPFEHPLPVNMAHKKLAIGYGVTVGVKEDGAVWSWGGGGRGELGNGFSSSSRNVPAPLQGMTDFIEVAGNAEHFLALRKDGTVWGWGDNQYGQLGYKTDKWFSTLPRQIQGLKDIVSVAAGGKYSLALDKTGGLYFFGINERWGVSTNKKLTDFIESSPLLLLREQRAAKVVMQGVDAALLAEDGQAWLCCDKQTQGLQLKVFPQKVADISFSLGATYYLLLNGFVMAEGVNNYGELGQGNYNPYSGVVQVNNIGRIKNIAATYSSGFAVDEMGRVWQWGANVRRPLIAGVQSNYEPFPIFIYKFPNAISAQGGFSNSVLLDNGKVYFWGWNRAGGRGTGKPAPNVQVRSHDWSVPELSLWTWK